MTEKNCKLCKIHEELSYNIRKITWNRLKKKRRRSRGKFPQKTNRKIFFSHIYIFILKIINRIINAKYNCKNLYIHLKLIIRLFSTNLSINVDLKNIYLISCSIEVVISIMKTTRNEKKEKNLYLYGVGLFLACNTA